MKGRIHHPEWHHPCHITSDQRALTHQIRVPSSRLIIPPRYDPSGKAADREHLETTSTYAQLYYKRPAFAPIYNITS